MDLSLSLACESVKVILDSCDGLNRRGGGAEWRGFLGKGMEKGLEGSGEHRMGLEPSRTTALGFVFVDVGSGATRHKLHSKIMNKKWVIHEVQLLWL
jgi:hypothetical protein